MGNVNCMYYLVNTKRPLEEKMALFWHHVFATGNSKVDNYDQLLKQIEICSASSGMGNYRDLLLDVAKNPTMIFWLDNHQNHGTAVNENWGHERSRACSASAPETTPKRTSANARAFTGWTFETKIPRLPYGRFPWKFEYDPEDHDDREGIPGPSRPPATAKTSSTSLCNNQACARFICRRSSPRLLRCRRAPGASLVTKENHVDPAALDTLVKVFRDLNFEIRPVLRLIFNSDFFKSPATSTSSLPAEVVVSTLRLVGGHDVPKPVHGECR